ncbi:P1 family peptidase [Rubrivirga sp. IMCC45206]|uniref:DmpA family aminopeptidase n=1 Tax=Rubrivirga sp. IMCC45206 TaxID=3391614 RepID=UPI00398FF020
MLRLTLLLLAVLLAVPVASGQGLRARDLGIPFEGIPGPLNAITDVPGVEVGHTTIIEGDGALVKGEGPVRTGVTAILPRGRTFDPVMAATYALNGNGEMTGVHWIEESGYLETPITITNTFSVGVVRDAVIAWMDSTALNADPAGGLWYTYPLVAETYDVLNDILGQHVTRAHAFAALDAAAPGPVAEGNVGGGTGMMVHGFKGGIGTSSRLTGSGHTLGVLVQANYGGRDRFQVAGVPVGQEITDLMPNWDAIPRGSIIVVVATDAPLLPQQLQRLAERVPLAIGRMGGVASNGSGDIFVAFSTANAGAWAERPVAALASMPNDDMTDLFGATVDATEEAILNAMVAAETMTGRDGLTAHALPHDRLQDVLRRYNRWVEPSSLPRVAVATPSDLDAWVGRYEGDGPFANAQITLEGDVLMLEAGPGRRRIVRLGSGEWRLLGTALTLEPAPSGVQVMRGGEPAFLLDRVDE